jgi:putative hemolysin
LKTQKTHILAIEKAMLNDEAIIFFPAGEVSRFTLKGIRDRKWQKGALKMAKKFKAPILPVFVKGRNSIIFYALSLVFKKLSIFLLPREIFNKKGYAITLKIGDPIPYTSINNNFINNKLQNNILRKHITLIGKNKSGIIKTEKTIIHPISVRLIKSELWRSEKLGFTFDGKEIWLVDGKFSRNIMKEITRLREITYRKVGEGTGKKADYDSFDEYFKHLVLWDDKNLEIVGAYRLGFCNEIIDRYGINGLYNSGQFNFENEFNDILGQSIELGRSFIQQKYWNSNALDYLWQGIGAVLIAHPEIRYLVGAVSISNSYSESAKALIVRYYEKWYSSDHKLVDSKCKFYISKNTDEEVKLVLNNNLMIDDFKAMKRELKAMGFSVPVLLRKYSEICSKEGVQFLDYGIDKDFSDSIDYFICLDMNFINQNFKERYYSQKSFVNQVVATN